MVDRLIKRDENGTIICSQYLASFVAKRVPCDRCCMDCEEFFIRAKLLEYELEEERREKGCDMCKEIIPGVCRLDLLHVSYSDVAGNIHDLNGGITKYCFNCGRKLVE